jgi:hypothetical protein
MARQLKPLLSMMNPHRPARMIRLRYCCFGATRYLIDADRSTLRLSTGYPIETYL